MNRERDREILYIFIDCGALYQNDSNDSNPDLIFPFLFVIPS